MIPPSFYAVFESLQNFTAYYITVASIGLILFGLWICSILWSIKLNEINKRLQLRLYRAERRNKHLETMIESYCSPACSTSADGIVNGHKDQPDHIFHSD